MKIASSKIALASQHTYREKYHRQESLRAWVGNRTFTLDSSDSSRSLKDRFILSPEGKELVQKLRELKHEKVEQQEEIEIDQFLSPKDQQRIAIAEQILSKLLGKEVKIKIPQFKLRDQDLVTLQNLHPPQNIRQGWGLEYNYQESYLEQETLSLQAQGVFHTTDGKTVNFTAEMNLSRKFIQQTNIQFKAGDALLDPLVINFNGPAAQLTDSKFSFDLDADGNEELISFLTPDSGFLVLDKNGDGVVNDGSELFGPLNGDGFSQLAQYDTDQNHWIDEADPIFHQLQIWTKNQEGEDRLFALVEKGIGAIYLGNIEAQFQLKNQSNQLQGLAQKAGLFVKEDGNVGIIQQIDLVV